MTGIPTKFVVADLVVKRLKQDGSPHYNLAAQPNTAPYFYLGCLGSSFGDLMRSSPELASTANSPYFNVWLPLLEIIAGNKENASVTPVIKANRGLYRGLRQMRETLSKFKEAVHNKSKFDLLGMIGELQALQTVSDELKASMATLQNARVQIGTAILSTSKPEVKTRPSRAWQVRDTLAGSQTGAFLAKLRDNASDDRMKAFALGATIAYSTELVGSPYVNSAVKSVYRNHWWRHRFIRNFVDVWVYGFYGKGGSDAIFMNDRVPVPTYTNWPNVLGGALHKKIELAGMDQGVILDCIRDKTVLPNYLPQDFVDYYVNSFNQVYRPTNAAPETRVTTEAVQTSFAMTWLVLWIQTSGEVLQSIPPDQIPYPDDCGVRPDWVAVDGAVALGGQPGGLVRPDKATFERDPSIAEIISGIALAIIGAAALLVNVAAGVAIILAGLALIADGATDPDWHYFQCQSDWLEVYVADLNNTFIHLLSLSGLGFCYTLELAHDDQEFTLFGRISPLESALATVRSPGFQSGNPHQTWRRLASDWAKEPAEPTELPERTLYPFDGTTWPFHFVDGMKPQSTKPAKATDPLVPTQINPLNVQSGRPPLTRDPIEFSSRQGGLNSPFNQNRFFGNAVDVSIDLINSSPKELLNWDLDGDPGIGTPTWVLPTASSPRSSSEAE